MVVRSVILRGFPAARVDELFLTESLHILFEGFGQKSFMLVFHMSVEILF